MAEKRYLKWYNKVGYGSGNIAGNVVYMNTAALQYFSQITRDLSPEQFHQLLNIIKEIVAVMR